MSVLGIRLANMALFLMATWLTADVVTDVAASILIPTAASSQARSAPPPATTQPWSTRQAILDRNLFGAQVMGDDLLVEEEPDEELQETKLPLKLLGTIASNDQVVASAAIENSRKRTHEVVKVGDRLMDFKEVVVSRIDRGRVVLQNGANREELKMGEELMAQAKVKASKPKPRPSRRRASKQKSNETVQDRLKSLADNSGISGAAALLSQARVLPKYEDGKMVGIELSQIESNSLYQKVGLQDGDMLTSVNGVTIDNPAASQELLKALTESPALVAEVLTPNGEGKVITIPQEQLAELMQGAE